MFKDNTSRLFGLHVRLPDGCRCCNSDIAVIGRGAGPHAGELRCECGHHRDWLSKFTARWIATIVTKFGCPDGPIRLRRR
jgi:hypothetical protein